MTDPPRPEDPTEPNPPAPQARVFGLTTFTIEGRRAPALFVVGWIATFVGGGFAALTLLGIPGIPGTIVWLVGLALASVGLVLLGGSQAIERRVAGAAWAGPSPVLVLLVILATSQLAGFAVGVPLSLLVHNVPRPIADLLGVIVQAGVFAGVLGVTVVGSNAMSWSDMGLRRGLAGAVRGLVGGAVFAGPVILVTAVLASLTAQITGAVPASPLPPTGSLSGLLLHLVAGAVIAPVAEELVFRGFALTAWRRTVGPRSAIVRSSIVFVLAHVLFVGGDGFREAASLAFVAGIARVPVALALGWLYVRTGSLWGPIGLHAAYNAILIVLGEALAAG